MSEQRDIHLLLSAYADGELDAPERERVETALAERPELQRELDGIRRLDRAGQPADNVEPPSDAQWADMWTNIRRDIKKQPQRVERRRPRMLRLFFTITAAAAAVAFAGSIVLLSSQAPSQPRQLELPGQIAESVPEVEALEVDGMRRMEIETAQTQRVLYVPESAVGQ